MSTINWSKEDAERHATREKAIAELDRASDAKRGVYGASDIATEGRALAAQIRTGLLVPASAQGIVTALCKDVERLQGLLVQENAFGEQYEAVIVSLGKEIARLRVQLEIANDRLIDQVFQQKIIDSEN